MYGLKAILTSSIGQKYVMAVTGLALFGFILVHLAGNLMLYVPDGGHMFNTYAKGLHDLGPILYIAEAGLAAIFLLHAAMAIYLKVTVRDARPVGYRGGQNSKGKDSKYGLASRGMIITGIVLFVFLILHIIHFKFGPMYTTMLGDAEARDLYKLVAEEFSKPWISGSYIIVMIFLGFHLRHGFWSAFQSLGAMNPKWSKPIYGLGLLLAVLITAGFLFIPVWFLLDMPVRLQ